MENKKQPERFQIKIFKISDSDCLLWLDDHHNRQLAISDVPEEIENLGVYAKPMVSELTMLAKISKAEPGTVVSIPMEEAYE